MAACAIGQERLSKLELPMRYLRVAIGALEMVLGDVRPMDELGLAVLLKALDVTGEALLPRDIAGAAGDVHMARQTLDPAFEIRRMIEDDPPDENLIFGRAVAAVAIPQGLPARDTSEVTDQTGALVYS